MAWFLFIDESGHGLAEDRAYEVLAGIAIQDRDLWTLVNALHTAETRHFGRRYSEGRDELKGKKILKKKVFHHLSLSTNVHIDDVPFLAKSALDNGAAAEVRHLKALAMAKTAYVNEVFDICQRFRCKAFASIVDPDAHPTATDGLRKDYAYLFQRFFYFLEDAGASQQGVIVFDELEKSRSHILINQTHKYFKETAVGRHRAQLVVPEPLFVHSDLTTGVQIADLIAYCVSWGFRTNQINRPAREELAPYAQKVASLRHRTERELDGQNRVIWSFAYITDLRTRNEKEMEMEE